MKKVELFNKIVAGITEIHPIASLAWSVISAANKVLLKQKDRDERIIRLAGTMSDVFAFVHDVEPLKAIKTHLKTITLLIRQVTECGYFIAGYTKRKNFWIRTARYTLSDIDSKINDYEKNFQELKAGFVEGVTVQTGVTMVRMMNVIEPASRSIESTLQSDVHARGTQLSPSSSTTCHMRLALGMRRRRDAFQGHARPSCMTFVKFSTMRTTKLHEYAF